jgi:TonB family protein
MVTVAHSFRLATAFLFIVPAVSAQSRTDGLIAAARAHITAHEFDKADTALSDALGAAGYMMDSVHVFVWRAILGHLRGSDSLARENFRTALVLYPPLKVNGLDQVAAGLDEIFQSESRSMRVYGGNQLDQQASWHSGPALAYPADLRRRGVSGQATVMITVDTTGHLEPQGFHVVEVPDSAFVEPLRQMLLAATFTPGRIKGQAVRSALNLTFTLKPPPPKNPTVLIGSARDQLRGHHPDSAVALTQEALDSANRATPGERVYALLVQGLALHGEQRDSAAAVAFDAGLAGYRDLTARGVDLAPFLKRLADSIRVSRRGARPAQPAAKASPFGAPAAVDAVDEQPVLVSHPAIRYAPEMQALRIGGTVIVEATLDTSGRVMPATVKIAQSPNPVFDAESKRVVLAAVYRPARVRGRATRATIRQPITFAAY